jgi:hypothetical protein
MKGGNPMAAVVAALKMDCIMVPAMSRIAILNAAFDVLLVVALAVMR